MKKIYLLFAVLCGIDLNLSAQLQSWNGLAVEYEMSRTWAAETELEYRFPIAGEAAPGDWLFTLAANRLLSGRFDVTPGLRYTFAQAEAPAELRLFTDLNYDLSFTKDSPFELAFRLRYQQDRPLGENGNQREIAVRPRLGANYALHDQWTVAFQLEGRYRFDRFAGWSRVRYTGGIEFTPADHLQIDAFYRRERFLAAAGGGVEPIVGVYLSYRLGSKKRGDAPPRRPFGRRLLW